jgi:phage baseplate assembly protein W
MIRHDLAYPFRISAASGQAAQSAYADHVDEMIRQILLTDPGERVCLPQFGAGLRRLLFAPISTALEATTKLTVTKALNTWMGGQIVIKGVTVATADDPPTPGSDGPIPPGAILVRVDYQLVETRGTRQTSVMVS